MGWFDEQIQERIRHDDEAFREAMAGMADVVMGGKLARVLQDERIQTRDAIEEILKYYHVKSWELPENIRTLDEQLEYLMRPAGIMRRTVLLKEEWYQDAVGAMLGLLKEDGGVVALLPAKTQGYTFLDKKSGKRVRLNRQTAELLEQEAVCFYKPLPLTKIGIRELLVYMAQTLSPWDIALVVLSTLAVSLVGLLVPWINHMIYGEVISGGSLQLLFAVFTFLLCVSLSQTVLETVKSLLLNRISVKMNIQVQAAGMMRILSLPAHFFKKYSAGDLASRANYITTLCTMLTNTLLTMGLTSVFSLVYLTQMIRYARGVVVPGMLVILFTVLFSVITTFIQLQVSKRAMELSAKEAGIDYALISGVQKIRLAGAEKRAFAKWARAYRQVAELLYDPPAFLKLSHVLSTCISLVGTIVIYYFTIQTKVPLADYYSFNAAYGCVMGAFSAIAGVVGNFAQAGSMLDMLKPILETVPEVSEQKKVVTRLSGGIELNHVSFRYQEDMPLVIDDLSLKIRPGQYVAIVGATGCGKSTLLRLMLGFETPQKGAVYYDGQDLASLDLKSLRRRIGTVMQDGKLFQGDIFSNITISAPQLSMDEAWEAADLSGMGEDIRNMPMGMHTIISEGSGGISGGQRQRLMIARAIAPKPRILMFDEATSALDNLTQKTVSDSLTQLKCTRIVIAHRLSTIRQCDRIIVLEKGKIIEDGTYKELMKCNGFFAELVERQRLDDTAYVGQTTLH